MQKRVMAINDISCYGRCALTVSLPIISACGVECSIIPTAILSTHLAYPNPTSLSMTDEISPIANHLKSINAEFDAIACGYLDNARQIELVSDFLDKFKSEDTAIIVDPTMADHGKMYGNPAFDSNFLQKMKTLVSKADLIIPNITEAAFLTDMPFEKNPDRKYIEALLGKLLDLGAKSVIITGVSFDENKIGSAVISQSGKEPSYFFAEKYEGRFIGTGDIFAAVTTGALLNGFSIEQSTEIATEFVSFAINKTLQVNTKCSMSINFEQSISKLLGLLGLNEN